MGKVRKICVRTEGEKRRILLSCHAGIEGKTIIFSRYDIFKKCSCIMFVHELSICICSKQTVILSVLAPTSNFSRQESILSITFIRGSHIYLGVNDWGVIYA